MVASTVIQVYLCFEKENKGEVVFESSKFKIQ